MLATQLQLRQARHEASQLELVKTAQADEIKALHAKLDELQEVHKSTSNELTDVTALRAELAELKLHQQTHEALTAENQNVWAEQEQDLERKRKVSSVLYLSQ